MNTRWPPPRDAMPSDSRRARMIGARRLTSSARSISSSENDSSTPLPGTPALATSTSTGPASSTRRSRAARCVSSHGTTRPPTSAASGSSTSTRRALRTSCAPRRASARAITCPSPPLAPVKSAVRPPRFTQEPSQNTHGGAPTTRHRGAPTIRRWRAPLGGSREDGDGGGEAVEEVLASDGADLAGGEESRGRRSRERFVDRRGVVIGVAEQVAAPAVAREQERAGRGAAAKRPHADAEGLAEVAVGARGVAGVEADDLPGVDPGGDRNLARLGIGAHETSHQEVALDVLRLVGLEHDPHQQPTLHQREVLLRELLDRVAQLVERRLA